MLLEVVVGFTLFMAVVLATGSGTMFATASASAAKQRSVAATLVAADAATVNALPFADLTAGLNPVADNLATDPNIQVVGSSYVLRLTGATIAAANTNTSEGPLVPHVSTTTIGTRFSVATYPLVASSGTVTVVVVASWPSALGGTGSVVGEVQVAAP